MTVSTVTWRQAAAAVAAVVIALISVTVVFSSDGLPAVDASAARATRWFVHRPSGTVVLTDGYAGRAIASLDTEAAGTDMSVAEAAAGAYLLNDSTAEVRPIETADLKFGAPILLTPLGDGRAISAVGPAGLTVVNPIDGQATLLPISGEALPFDITTGGAAVDATLIAPDGAIWTIDGTLLRRQSSTSSTAEDLGLGDGATLSLAGDEPIVLDRSNRRARFGDGAWQSLDGGIDPSEFVLQHPGPTAECGWIGANDELWCLSDDGITERTTIPGLGIEGSDDLAIAGDAAVVVHRSPAAIVRFDWRTQSVLEDQPLSVEADEVLEVSASVDLVWVDEVDGDLVWAVNPWGVNAIDKNGDDIFVVGEDGAPADQGDVDDAGIPSTGDGEVGETVDREPDSNGVDDAPVAVDDPVTARSGSSVPVQVTANDYDPDGEAIAVSAVGRPGHGTVEIGTATTVVYTPDSGYVGRDAFEYTIVDGNGTEDTATVVIELLPVDAANSPPVGNADQAESGPGTPVVVDVLLNDVDPERDALRLGSFTPADNIGGATIGEVTETVGPSGLPALRFAPAVGFEGTAIFSYRPVDSLGGQGDDVEVRVDVATDTAANRPPIARPDAVRARRDVPTPVPVLVNDVDPDGDDLTLSVVEPLPAGLAVAVRGVEVTITVGAGAGELLPFQYEISDGRGGMARGAVLVDVISDVEPNLPPVLTADTGTVVVGSTVTIDVLANDIDPDGDPLVIIGVDQPDEGLGQVAVLGTRLRFTPGSVTDRDETNARFTYTVSDGNGHAVTGDVSVSVLRESVARPPYARDDSTFTTVDSPVTVDVLRNDGDPSGERPTIVGTPGCPGGGLAVVTTDGQVRFDPPTGRTGAFRCTYEVTNSQNLRAGASIIVSVREPQLTNQPPVANEDRLVVEVGSTGVSDVAANDVDPDGSNAALTVVSSTAPTLGTAVRRANSITFTAGQVVGVTTIKYQVADPEGAVSLGQLSVQVIERANRPPVAESASRNIYAPGVPWSFDVLAGAVDPDNTPGGLTLQSANKLSGDGTVSSAGRVVTITPNSSPNFVGTIVATFTIVDGDGETATAQLTLNVLEPLNRAPVARDDSAEVSNGASANVAVLYNDSDPDGDPLTIDLLSGPDASLGTARLTSERAISFTAAPGASGVATIEYSISDGEFTSTARLRITVRACSESQPVAGDGFLRTGYMQPIAIDLNAYGANGVFVDVAGPSGYVDGVYTPAPGENGNVSVTYTVVNGCRLRASGRITIDVNQDPVVRPQSFTIGRGENIELPVSNIATDAETLTIQSSDGAPSWVTSESNRLLFQPPVGTPIGTFTWTSVVRDPGGLTAAVPMSVTLANQAPTAFPDSVDASGSGPVVVSVLDNDVDPDAANAGLLIQSVPATITFPNGANGTVSIVDGGRRLSIDRGLGRGTVSFDYTAHDGDGAASAPATVTVIGPALNTAPYANDQTASGATNAEINIALDAGDADAGDVLTLVELNDPALIVRAQAGLSLTVSAPTAGTYQITYRVNDGTVSSGLATITVSVTDPPDPPETTLPPGEPADG